MSTDDARLKHLAATHLLHAAEPLSASIQARLREETGFRLSDSEALRIIDAAEHPLRMSDIAARLIVSKAGATKLVDRLEADGLVQRRGDPADRRAYLVDLTPSGQAALAANRPVVDAAIERLWSRHLTSAEARTVLEIVDRVIEANPDWYD